MCIEFCINFVAFRLVIIYCPNVDKILQAHQFLFLIQISLYVFGLKM